MTLDEACDFFHRYGNVGKTVEDLKNNKPTQAQLNAAIDRAKLIQPIELVLEAASAIEVLLK